MKSKRVIVSLLIAYLSLTISDGVSQAQQKPDATPYTWKSVQIVGGGFVSGIITHPKAKGVMYARTDIGGAYRWEQSMKSWVPITDWVGNENWNLTGIESLAVDPSDAGKVYIAAGTYTKSWAKNGAILRSSDAGRTWQQTDLPFRNGGNEDGRSNGERLAVDPNDGRVLFFGTRDNGLWTSTDAAVTWSQIQSFPVTGKTNGIGTVFVIFDTAGATPGAPTRTIYAGVSSKETNLYRSTDGGKTWNPVEGQPAGFVPHHAALDVDGSMYLTYSNGPGPNGVTDGALRKLDTKSGKWSDISPIKPAENDRFGYAGVTVDAQRSGTVIVSTIDRWSRGDDAFRTLDGGKTWKPLRANSERDHSAAPWLTWGKPKADFGHWIGDIEIDPFDSDRVLYGTGTGIWATEDVTQVDAGKTTHWFAAARGLEECVINEIVSPPSGAPLLSVMWDIDGFRHADLDESPRDGFFKPAGGHDTGIDFAELDPDFVVRVHGGKSHGSFSNDNGKTWTPFVSNASLKGGGKIAVSADGSAILSTPDGPQAYLSTDRGTTWIPCEGLPQKVRVVTDRATPGVFYGYDGKAGKTYVSRDNGRHFSEASSTAPRGDGFQQAVPGKPGHIWLAHQSGLYFSVDGGNTFEKAPGVDSSLRVGFGKAAPGADYPAIYMTATLAGQYGIYRSVDRGRAWTRVNDDQHQYAWISTITGDPRVFGRVYIGSGSRGIVYGEPH